MGVVLDRLKAAGGSGSGSRFVIPNAPDPSSGGGDSILGKIASGITDAVEGVPRGILNLGEEAWRIARLPNTVLANVLFRQNADELNANPILRNLTDPAVTPQAGADPMDRIKAALPVSNALVQGGIQTASHLNPSGGFKSLREDYGNDPVGSALNDAANIATILTAGGAAATKAGAALDSAGAAGAGERLAAAGEAANKVAALPFLPYQKLAEAPGLLGAKAFEATMPAAEGAAEPGRLTRAIMGAPGEPSKLAQAAVRLSQPAQDLQQAILGGKAKEEALTEQAAKRANKQNSLLSPVEQQAATAVAEHTAPALAVLREHLPSQFDKFVEDRYAGTLTPEAAHLAADVVTGQAPETAAKIDAAIHANQEAPGGRTERNTAYVAQKPWQAGYEANPTAVNNAVADATKGLPKAVREAEQLRTAAEKAKSLLADASPKTEIPDGALVHYTTPEAAAAIEKGGFRLSDAPHGSELGTGVYVGKYGHLGMEQMVASLREAGGEGRYVEAAIDPSARIFDIRSIENPNGTLNRLKAEQAGLDVAGWGGLNDTGFVGRAAKAAGFDGVTDGTQTVVFDPKNVTAVKGATANPERLGALKERARLADKTATKAERQVSKLEAAGEQARKAAEADIANAPSRLKPALAENQAVAGALRDQVYALREQGLHGAADQLRAAMRDVPTDLSSLEAAGIDPEHLFHTQEGRTSKTGRIVQDQSLPRTFKASSERLREGSPVYDRSAFGQFQGEREAGVAAIRRQTAEKIGDMPGVGFRLGEGPLASARTVEDAVSAGFVPWNPGTLFDTNGRVRPLTDQMVQNGIEHTQVFMPRPLFEQFRNYFEKPRGDLLGLATDAPNRLYYLARLRLSPAYVVGNAVGNMALATLGSGNPLGVARNLFDIVKEYRKTGEFPAEVPERVLQSGQNVNELHRFQADLDKGGVGRKGVSKFLNKSIETGGIASKMHLPDTFKATRFLDNAYRAAHYMTELDKTGSPESALRSTLRSMGEFDKMSPVERDYIRRVIPMWAWHREITKVAFHLAEDHPLRVAWVLHLGNAVGKQDSGIPDFYGSTIPIAGKLVDPGQLFPHGEVGSLLGGGYGGVGKFLGPTAKVTLGSLTGMNPSSGKPFTRPGGFGQPAQAPSILTQVLNQFPQTKLIEGAVLGNNDVARYSTGDPILVGKKGHKTEVPSGQDRLSAILAALGLPMTDEAAATRTANTQGATVVPLKISKPKRAKSG